MDYIFLGKFIFRKIPNYWRY